VIRVNNNNNSEVNMDIYRSNEKLWLSKNPLRIWRADNNVFQKDLGAAIGVGYHTIFRWESEMSMPNEGQLEQLSRIMKNENLKNEYQEWIKARPILGKEE